MSATMCLSLAARALEESAATALPQPMLWPSLSEMDTGTRSPITPASRSTAPINKINRLIVTLELLCHSQTAEVPTLTDIKLENRIRTDPSDVVRYQDQLRIAVDNVGTPKNLAYQVITTKQPHCP
jgi:hypothetical protein